MTVTASIYPSVTVIASAYPSVTVLAPIYPSATVLVLIYPSVTVIASNHQFSASAVKLEFLRSERRLRSGRHFAQSVVYSRFRHSLYALTCGCFHLSSLGSDLRTCRLLLCVVLLL